MRSRLAALVVAAGLAVAACGGGDAGTAASDTTTGAGDRASPRAEGPDFLQFTADDVRGGDPVDASVYAGSDLVLWFWAPW